MAFSIVWKNNADGMWNVAGNWNPSGPPTITDDVGIDTTNLHTITYSEGTSYVNSLTVGNDNLTITGGFLNVETNASFAHAVSIQSGNLDVLGGITGAGTYSVGATGTLDVDASSSSTPNTVNVVSNTGSVYLNGGSAADIFKFNVGALQSTDTISGGAGSAVDEIVFNNPGTIAANVFTGVSGIEELRLGNGTNNVSLNTAVVDSSNNNHLLTVIGSSGSETLNASAVASASDAVMFYSGPGNDSFTGGQDVDTLLIAPTNLTSADSFNGGTGGALDKLYFGAPGTVATSAFTNVSHVEVIQLTDGTNNVTLTNALVTTADDGHLLTVLGAAGNDTINASAVTTASDFVTYQAGTGNDTLIGGLDTDTFVFASPAGLTSGDTVNGGTGSSLDVLQFSAAGFIMASAFTNVGHIELIKFANGTNNVTLTDALVNSADDSHVLGIVGGTGNDTINASAVTTASDYINFHPGTGNDVLTGGLDTDTFVFAAAADLTSGDIVNGGTGSSLDILQFSTPGTIATGAFTNVGHVEEVKLANGINNVVLTNAMVTSADDGHLLGVVGGTGNDTINASAVTTAANYITYHPGTGNDDLTGGLDTDTFVFATTSDLTSGDTVNGGAGSSIDAIYFNSAGTIAESAFTDVSHIEEIKLANGTNEITLSDSMVSSADDGHLLTVIGGSGSDQIDASGVFTAGNVVHLQGGGGADSLFASAGVDTFIYTAPSDSTGNANGTAYDTLHAFDPTVDKIDLPSGFTVAGVTQVMSGALSSASFDTDMAAAIGSVLTSRQAVEFHVTSGSLSGDVFLVVNPTGTTGYVSGHDYVFDISGSAEGTYTPGTFV